MSKKSNIKPVKNSEILHEWYALCPLDGRYAAIAKKLSPYFSEIALMKNRVKVEIYWLKFLLENIKSSEILNSIDKTRIPEIMDIYNNFSTDFMQYSEEMDMIKNHEKTTRHDVKSVEYFIDDKLRAMGGGLEKLIPFVHLGCTSEDINNTAYANMLKGAINDVWVPAAEKLIYNLSKIAINNSNTKMLAHTHGQPATPTTVGKEFAVYVYRLQKSLNLVKSIKPLGKFNGATGNYSAISIAFPNEDWPKLSKKFIEDYLDLTFNPVTTQIENHDYMCQIFDAIKLFNNELLDLDLDMWTYISMGYFKQITVKSEVGSSTMPHKVNPIRFENSESNIDISNAILNALSNKLPRSRMQRDLSDSSSQRNIGLGLGYSLQAIDQTIGGLEKVEVNNNKLSEDLDNNWEVLAEPIQTMLRKYGILDAYEQLKELTRGSHVSQEVLKEFISTLTLLSPEDRNTLLNLTPNRYTGLAETIALEAAGDTYLQGKEKEQN